MKAAREAAAAEALAAISGGEISLEQQAMLR